VFAKFTELGSARGVMRYLRANNLPLPVRPLGHHTICSKSYAKPPGAGT
jgi:hypothetical protein